MNEDAAIDRIVEQVLARLREKTGTESNLDGRSCVDCSTPGECASVCPTTTASILREGVDRLSHRPGASGEVPGDIAGMIDHTILKADATRAELEKLLDEAKRFGFASVCVNPCWVRHCSESLRQTRVLVCTVVGFPLGANASETKAFETRRACYDGAKEIDMVINVGALKSGDDALVRRDIEAVVVAARGQARVKVILETALLSKEEIIKASLLAKMAGADFVKTSTGFGGGGATVEDIALMRETVGPEMGVKASGGINDRDTAEAMVAAGATRIGASASVAITTGQKSTVKGY